jgi:hypothetical protein
MWFFALFFALLISCSLIFGTRFSNCARASIAPNALASKSQEYASISSLFTMEPSRYNDASLKGASEFLNRTAFSIRPYCFFRIVPQSVTPGIYVAQCDKRFYIARLSGNITPRDSCGSVLFQAFAVYGTEAQLCSRDVILQFSCLSQPFKRFGFVRREFGCVDDTYESVIHILAWFRLFSLDSLDC